jgi:hypothetical protein
VQSTGVGWLTGVGGERRAGGERLGEGVGMGGGQTWCGCWGGEGRAEVGLGGVTCCVQ